MTAKKTSSRRNFLKQGAMLAVPLAAAAPAAVMADDGLKSRLAKLENEAAIRNLHQTWLRHVNTAATDQARALFADPKGAAFDPTVRRIAADHEAEPDAFEVAPDVKSATGRFHCSVEIETPIAQDCTLAQMAHAQGTGFIRRTERRVLKVDYVKASGAWAIVRAEFSPA
jgi:hypothetical protein